LVFGLIFAYCLYGAIAGQLYIPPGKSGRGFYLSGIGAWLSTLFPVFCYLGLEALLVPEGNKLGATRLVLSGLLWACAVAAIVFAVRLGNPVAP
jgi:hypothetical protein